MVDVELPDVGEGVAEGEIVAWHVEPGDTVAEDDPLVEVETDKAVVDIPSSLEGTVTERHVEVGDVVPVGDVILSIDPDGDAGVAGQDAPEPEETGESEGSEHTDEEGSTAASASGRVFAPPNVRRLAREMGVDLQGVAGSGPGGRITEADVREAAGAGGSDDQTVESAIDAVDDAEAEPATTETETETGSSGERKQAIRRIDEDDGDAAADSTTADPPEASEQRTEREQTLAAPATRRLARELDVDVEAVPTDRTREGEPFVKPEDVRAYAESRAETAEVAGGGGSTADRPKADGERETREPYRGIRRSIGRKMEQSAYTAPHVSHHESVEVSGLVATRDRVRERIDDPDLRVTYLPFVLKAVVAGLREYPILNARLDEDSEEIVHQHYYDVGVAVATDRGLLVPVVRNVGEKGILELAREIQDLTERARAGDLAREEMQGGTFSITNFGAIGGEYATPIINYPETAILGLGAIEDRPWVEDGEVVARPVLPLSLSIDHRVIDGAEAARFVNTVADYLSTPGLLALDFEQ